jgi:hypothetical protein
VYKTWLKSHAYDLETSEMKRNIEEFIKLMEKSGAEKHAAPLIAAFEKLVHFLILFTSQSTAQQHFLPSTKPPKPLFDTGKFTTSSGNLDFSVLEPLEVARQITLIEFDFFKVILPKECLGQAWNKTGKESYAPHVLAMIHWSNRMSALVYTEVLKGTSPKGRSDMVKQWVKFAKV